MISNRALSLLLSMFILLLFASCEKDKNDLNKKTEPLIVLDSIVDVSSFGGSDGKIILDIRGGEKPLFLQWSTGDSSKSIDGLSAGSYTVYITYGGSGVFSQTYMVEEPGPKGFSIDYEVTDVSHFSAADGKIEITNIAGGIAPYAYLWQNEHWNLDDSVKTKNLEGLLPGQYKLYVTDSNPYQRVTDSIVIEVGRPAFRCGIDSVRDVDNNVYPTVLIGDQCWIAQNLKTVHNPTIPDELIEDRFCYNVYCFGAEGAHYTWHAAMNGSEGATGPYEEIQGICPDGWHIPTQKEWEDLDSLLSIPGNYGDGFFSGAKLKGKNSSTGFNALLIGNWGYDIYKTAEQASFWTATPSGKNTENANHKYLTEDTPLMNGGTSPKEYGLSVRCIKNK